jgi:NDP-sugar pyrophosphorylase family protein
MPTLFELLQKEQDKVVAYPIHERWLDVGRPDDLTTAIVDSQKRSEK